MFQLQHLLWIAALSLGFLACKQEKKAASSVEFEAYVRFVEDEGSVYAEAGFKENGQPVEMPGGVQYLEVGMRLMPVQGINYRIAYPAGYRPEHSFAWKDFKGRPQKFDFRMAPITAFAFDEGARISRTQPATLRWEGGAAEKGEVMVFMWENPENGTTIPMEVIPGLGQRYIEFPAAKLGMLSPGRWDLYMVRKKLSKGVMTNQTACSAIVEYYTSPTTLAILP